MATNNNLATGATVWTNGANAAASDNSYATTTNEELGVFSLGDGEVTIADGDTVNSVTIHVEAKDTLGDSIDVGLRIGGVLQGSVQSQTLTSTDTVYTFTDATNWDVDWTAAQVAGMEIEITSVQSGMPTSNTWSVDHVKAIIDYTLATGGAPQTIAVNQAAESSTAQSIVVATAFAAALGLATETDLAQVITPIQPSSVDRTVTYNPKADWNVIEVLSADKISTTSVFNGVVEAVIDESEIYYPSASGTTSITATGEVTTVASSFDLQWWDKSNSTWKQITYSGGQPIAVNQSTETDTAQTITPSTTLDLAVNQSVETDAAQAITVATEVSVTLNQSNETDLAQPIAVGTGLGVAVNQSTETDTAQSITPLNSVGIAVGQALETDLAQAITTTASSSIDRTVTYSPKANWAVVEVLSADLVSANSVLKDIASVPNESEIYYPITYSTSIAATGIITTSSTESIDLQWWSTTDSTWRQITYVIGTPFGQATETDLAQSITVSASNSIAVNQSTETDVAQSITVGLGSSGVSVGQSLESDTAQPITVATAVDLAFNQSTETDLAQPVTVSTAVSLAVNQSTETDIAQPITVGTGGALIAVGQSSETDLAQSITPLVGNVGVTVGQATETDLAQSILAPGSSSVDRSVTYSPKANWDVVESLSAPIGVAGKVGENFTGDAIQDESLFYYPTAYNTTITADGTISTDSTENITLQFWDKSDSTYKQVTLIITDPVGQALETDLALSITPSISGAGTTVAVGQSSETDLAQSISVSSSVSTTLNQSIETDLAQSITPLTGGVSVVVGQAIESGLAQSITPSIGGTGTTIGQATESDIAQTITVIVGNTNIAAGQSLETDLAQPITVSTSVSIAVGQAVELDLAQFIEIGTGSNISVGQSIETDIAQSITPLFGDVAIPLGQATETNLAQLINPVSGVIINPLLGSDRLFIVNLETRHDTISDEARHHIVADEVRRDTISSETRHDIVSNETRHYKA